MGAVRAAKAIWAHPGSMGARSYIVRGKGNMESFMSAATARTRPCPARKPSAASA